MFSALQAGVAISGPNVHPRTMGYDAVTEYAEGRSFAGDGLIRARRQVFDLGVKRGEQFKTYIGTGLPDVAAEIAEYAHEANLGWREWLTSDNLAANALLIKTMQYHVAQTEQLQQNPAVIREIDKQKEWMIRGIRAGIQQKWISEAAHDAPQKVADARIFIGDIFDDLYKDPKALGVYMPDTPNIWIRPDRVAKDGRRYDAAANVGVAAAHELAHLALSRDAARHSGTPHTFHWSFEETNAHQVVVAMRTGDPDVIDPHHPDRDPEIYAGIRNAHHLALTIPSSGGGPRRTQPQLPGRLYTLAYTGAVEDEVRLDTELDRLHRHEGYRSSLYAAVDEYERTKRLRLPNTTARHKQLGAYMEKYVSQADTTRGQLSLGVRRFIDRLLWASGPIG